MAPEERAAEITRCALVGTDFESSMVGGRGFWVRGMILDAIRAAVAEERERCARIALGLDSVDRGELTMDDWEHSLRSQTALNIAARIRGSDAPK